MNESFRYVFIKLHFSFFFSLRALREIFLNYSKVSQSNK